MVLSCDSLGHVSTPDLYSYADGDPVNNIDPDGRFFSEVYDTIKPTINDVVDYYSHLAPYDWEDAQRDMQALAFVGPLVGQVAGIATKALDSFRLVEGYKAVKHTAGNYRPDRSLPRDKYGNPIPDSSKAHTQLGKQTGRSGKYTQAREWEITENV